MQDETLLGLFDGYMSLDRDQLTSETKIGGTPIYLPELTEAQLAQIDSWSRCGVCGHKMFLLLQAYSPLTFGLSPHQPHNRMLYVLCCNSASCASQPSSSWVAFTVQVDSEDEQACEEAEDEEDTVIQTDALLPEELPHNTFPPCFVYIEEEPDKEVVVPTDIEQEMIRMAEENAKNGGGMSEDEIKELEASVDLKDKKVDYYYEKFRSRIARAPTQVLRYHQRSGGSSTGAEKKAQRPLFINPEKVKHFHSIPACSHCGAALVHELQVMPTVLYFLRVRQYVTAKEKAGTTEGCSTTTATATTSTSATTSSSAVTSGDDGVDFGTATVYTCSRNCAASQKGVYVRKEVLCVEEQPTLRDDRQSEEGTRRDLRHMMEIIDDDDEEEEEGEKESELAEVAADVTAEKS